MSLRKSDRSVLAYETVAFKRKKNVPLSLDMKYVDLVQGHKSEIFKALFMKSKSVNNKEEHKSSKRRIQPNTLESKKENFLSVKLHHLKIRKVWNVVSRIVAEK